MAETKAKHATAGAKTWRDLVPPYLPPPRLITRSELLAALTAAGMGITERTLRYWEAEGVLPRPVRQSHEGIVQAVYPDWYPFVVMKVYRHREGKLSLPTIAEDIPRAIQEIAVLAVAFDNKLLPLDIIPKGPELIELLKESIHAGDDPDRPIRHVQILLRDENYQLLHNLAWSVPAEGTSEQPIAQLSNGANNSEPFDSD